MNAKNAGVRVGVLNMTISFDSSARTPLLKSRKIEQMQFKVQTTPSFIPRYYSQQQRKNTTRSLQQALSPYQKYRRSHKDKLKVIREFSTLDNSQQIQALTSKNKFGQLELKNSQEQQSPPAHQSTRYCNENSFRKSIDKLSFRKTLESWQERNKPLQRLTFNLKNNPEDNLSTFFTIRPIATTAKRMRYKFIQKQPNIIISRPTITRTTVRAQIKSVIEDSERIIRPWSTSRPSGTKPQIFDSDVLEGMPNSRLH